MFEGDKVLELVPKWTNEAVSRFKTDRASGSKVL